MQKFNLNALENANMTVATEEALNEVNGGCTFKYGTFSVTCGGTYRGWMRTVNCGCHAPEGAARYARSNFAKRKTMFTVTASGSNKWRVDWDGGYCVVNSSQIQ